MLRFVSCINIMNGVFSLNPMEKAVQLGRMTFHREPKGVAVATHLACEAF